MKGKLSKYLIIFLPLLGAIYLLYPTWMANKLIDEENRLKESNDIQALEQFRAEHGEQLAKLKLGRLKLGLDLRGGMYVTLEVDAVKLLEEAADPTAAGDDLFMQVIDATRRESETSDEAVIKIFQKNFNNIAKAQGKSLVNYYDLANTNNVTEERIIEKLSRDIDDAIDQAQQVIRQRVDPTGTSEVNIQKQGTRRMLLELPGVNDEKAMRKLLEGTARLEFKLVRNGNTAILRSFAVVDRFLKSKSGNAPAAAPVKTDSAAAKPDSTKNTAVADSSKKDSTKAAASPADNANPYANLSAEETMRRYAVDHPFSSLMQIAVSNGGVFLVTDANLNQMPPETPFGIYVDETKLPLLDSLLKRPDIHRLLAGDLDLAIHAKPVPNSATDDGKKDFLVEVVKRDPELTGDVVTEAFPTFDQSTNSPIVSMSMNSDGAERWARITGANIKKQVAIILDGRVYSAPTVQNKITGGNSQITGMADIEEAKYLATTLKAGALKAPVKIIEERVVGPSLGEDSIRNGMMSAVIAFVLVVLFMIVYYAFAGAVANVAMLINVLLNIAALAGFGGTLSLPGIAGIILTIGLAVDANIIIFERIREEIYRGRTLRAAIDEGFRHALPPILDSHVTTMISGLILYFMGYGPIQGFALTLIIGILTTLFTGIIVSRAIIELWISRPGASIHFGQHPTIKL